MSAHHLTAALSVVPQMRTLHLKGFKTKCEASVNSRDVRQISTALFNSTIFKSYNLFFLFSFPENTFSSNSSLAWKPDKRALVIMIPVIREKKNLPAVDLNVNHLPRTSSVEQHLSNFDDLVQSFMYLLIFLSTCSAYYI